jgi:NAD(P)-dependent dehydrogenase (short-subunit alcohol dehydrogenase family)
MIVRMADVSFEGQVAVVTGGGRGLGRAYSLELARRGASVVVNDLVPEAERGSSVADEVVAEIEAAGGTAAAAYGNVATPEGAKDAVDTAVERFGTLDVVINNAGIMRNGWVEELTPEKFDAVVDVSVRGSFLVTQAAWPVLREKGYGRIVMVSSSGGMLAFGGIANYAAAKAGVYGLTKALSYEGEEHGIRVNAILPYGGPMSSIDVPPPGHARDFPEGLREKLTPLRTNEAVAVLVAALASRECPVNGEAYSVGYGRFARVFVGITPGWTTDDREGLSVERVLEHFDEIRDEEGYIVPRNQYDEVALIARTLGVA